MKKENSLRVWSILGILCITLIIIILSLNFALAHQPRIVFGKQTSSENPMIIDNPEISQAFYGNLNSSPDYYTINSFKDFDLYVSIVVPDLPDSRTDFNVEILKNNKFISILNGSSHNWTKFYEEFAGDDYLDGPEFDQRVSAGTYYIIVHNPVNLGKYSLAVGKVESFPIGETLKIFYTLPLIKKHFFNKPALSAYTSKVMLFVIIPVLIGIILLVILFFVVKFIIRKIKRNKKRKRR